jgi:hypothetical protein
MVSPYRHVKRQSSVFAGGLPSLGTRSASSRLTLLVALCVKIIAWHSTIKQPHLLHTRRYGYRCQRFELCLDAVTWST